MQLSLFSLFKFNRLDRAPAKLPVQAPAEQVPDRCDSDLLAIWLRLVERYFPERRDLVDYSVRWSRRRQKRTLASCNFGKRQVVVARELDHAPCQSWLEPLLYHEMCHAVLRDQVTRKGGRIAWHGKEFKALEQRHPGIAALDHWISQGGWARAVRSARARGAHRKRAGQGGRGTRSDR